MDNKMSLLPNFPIQNPHSIAKQVFDLRDVSEETRKDYKYRVSLFLHFVRGSGNGINVNSYLEFKRHLADKNNYSVSTKNKYLAAAKIFLKELNRRLILPADITLNIKSFSQDKKHKKEGITSEEMSRLILRLKDLPSTPQSARLKALLALLALQGLRQIEITRLNVGDLDLVAKLAFIHGKGRDDKEPVSLHPETVKTLKEYLKISKVADGPLFTSISNYHKNGRLTTRAVRKIIVKLLKELGIEKSVHGFRHYFTTTLIKTYKGDLLEVAQYTRHKGLEMLQVYNDAIKREADLPRFYSAFDGLSFD
ncbi:MAG: hypothetical protein G01um10147_1077 [Microgenomates group bacterium Gr01-1014_7]|nr:MAG: hypothetical protein G01um10147_1077 [Microgenomates group bacterium Gr01-1014_7]